MIIDSNFIESEHPPCNLVLPPTFPGDYDDAGDWLFSTIVFELNCASGQPCYGQKGPDRSWNSSCFVHVHPWIWFLLGILGYCVNYAKQPSSPQPFCGKFHQLETRRDCRNSMVASSLIWREFYDGSIESEIWLLIPTWSLKHVHEVSPRWYRPARRTIVYVFIACWWDIEILANMYPIRRLNPSCSSARTQARAQRLNVNHSDAGTLVPSLSTRRGGVA